MNYYEVALLKSPLSNLTYSSQSVLELGLEVLVKLRNRKSLSNAVIIKEVIKPSFKCTEIKELTNNFYDQKMLSIASFISMYYVSSLGEALSIYTAFDKNIKNDSKLITFDCKIQLSKQQEKAYEFTQNNKQALVFANTGSGKTEIYIKSIEKVLNEGKQAVLLMPEISLTPQMQNRLEKVFDTSVAIWHSKITKKKKEKIIESLLKGDLKLIAGARSSLFLPFKDLGLIIVDEEHDESYKSDSKPRYNAKDIALYMSKKLDIQVILGSATPSIVSFHKIPFIRVKETYFKTNKSITFNSSRDDIDDNIKKAIHNTLEAGHQVIIFLPTRANYKYQVCTSCGKAVQCPYCSVSMSLHKNALALKCHYCGYAQKIPEVCPTCETGHIHNLRIGTAQVEEELNALFQDKIIKRFDRDAITTDKKLRDILNDFNAEKIDILVGTQMLSKGHDYHNVKLAVVLGIDSLLNMNSFKARERALSLLIQISGRSGRKGQGEVIIQTQNEDFFDYYLKQRDYEEFLEEELEFREDLYPPFYKMAKVTFAHTNGLKVKDELDYFVNIFKDKKDLELVGFGQSGIFKIANKYRYEMILRSKNVKALLQSLHSINSNMASIDMDNIH